MMTLYVYICVPSANNFLLVYFQVVGKKYIRLYPASLSEELYPHTDSMLSNSSQVSLSH